MAMALQTNATLASAMRTGLFKAAIASTGSSNTAPFLGLILLAINGVAPNSNVNTRRLEAALARRLQTSVTVQAALLVAPISGGGANTDTAKAVAATINAQVLNAGSTILSTNLVSALSQLASAGYPNTGAAGVANSAAVVDPTPAASSTSNTGAVVGGVIGGIAVLGALVGLGFYWRKRQAASSAEYSSLKANAIDSNPYAAQRSYS